MCWMSGVECDKYIQIFEYIGHEYLFGHLFVPIFLCVKFVCMNIFGHSFVSLLECKSYMNIRMVIQFSIQIFICTFVRVKFSDMNIFGYWCV